MIIWLITFLLVQTPEKADLKIVRQHSHYSQALILKQIYAKGITQKKLNNLYSKLVLSPYREFALAHMALNTADAKIRLDLLKKELPICRKIHESKYTAKEIAMWINADRCSIDVRTNLMEICGNSGSKITSMYINEILWKTLPSHVNSLSWLLQATEYAKQLDNNRKHQLERFLLVFHPDSINDSDFIRMTKSMPCNHRTDLIENMLKRGSYARLPLLFKDCAFPVAQARLEYLTGNYGKAWEFIKDQGESRWKNRIKNFFLPPENSLENYLKQYSSNKKPSSLKRLVKSGLLSHEYTSVMGVLEAWKGDDCWLNFMKGYLRYSSGNKKQASKFWNELKCNHPAEVARSDYWKHKLTGKIPAFRWTRKVPEEAYYRQLIDNSRRKLAPAPIELFVLKPRISRFSLKRISENTNLPDELRFGLSLMSTGLEDLSSPCLYRGMVSISKRNRRTPDQLLSCWDLAEGNGAKCKKEKFLIDKEHGISPEIHRSIAMKMDWPHLAPFWGEMLPRPYEKTIRQISTTVGIPAGLLYAIMYSESNFEPFIISSAQAVGLFQIIPPTGMEISLKLGDRNFLPQQLLIPSVSIRYGATYLKFLADKFHNNWPLVVAAYNAGPHQVERWLKNRKGIEMDRWVEEIPFNETRIYVKRVMGRWILYSRELGEQKPWWPAKHTEKRI